MVSWDVAERTIDSTSPACRGSLQDVLERPNEILSPTCRAEVGRILERQSRRGDSKPRRGSKDGAQNDAADIDPDSRRDQPTAAQSKVGTHPATIVFMFVICALVAFAAIAFYVSGGRGIGGRQPARGSKRWNKKKQDRIRERGKRRR